MMTAFTHSFDIISVADLAQVGGKGANLGELTQAGFNVPPGFCVNTRAFTLFMAPASQDIYTCLDTVTTDNLEHLRDVGNTVRTYLDNVPLPVEVADAVVQSWRELGEDDAYAVRSSATAEDLPHASFAGQQDTYLNVCGKAALLSSVKACFISLFTDRAILYRVQNHFDHRKVALAVVVQRMVQPDVAGILFTADPVTGSRNIVSIDASFGLGEALVSGLVTADLYQVDKNTNHIVTRNIATKQMAIRALAEGGTARVVLAESEGNRAALTDTQVLALTKLGRQIESHYATPQDIEWALADNRLYITQSRPVTTLYPLPQPKPEGDALRVYVSLSHIQVMTDAMPPLALSVVRTIPPFGRVAGQIESTRIQTAGGRLYADLSPILRHPVGRHMLPRGLTHADQLSATALVDLARRDDFQSHGERFKPLKLLPTVSPYVLKMVRMLLWGRPEGLSGATLQLIEDHIVATRTRLNAAHDVQKKLGMIVLEIRNAVKRVFTWAPSLVAGVVAAVLLKVLAHKWADPNDLRALGRGLTGNVGTEMNLAVGDLADAARASEVLTTHLSRTDIDAQTRLAAAADLPGGVAFLHTWNTFIRTYGARGPSEIDLSRPRWSEDPSSLLQMVVNALGNHEAGVHRSHYQQLIREGEHAATTIIHTSYMGWWGWIRGPLTRRLIRVSRNITPIREHHKFFVIRLLELVKPVLIEAGTKLYDEGRLESSEDVWFLTLPELLEAFDQPEQELKERITRRQRDFEQYQKLIPPRVITSEGEIPVVTLEQPEVPAGALIGSPVSAGVVEGVARVVLDPKSEALAPGDILVAPFTDPGWTPLFVNAAGLITEVGGLMTHGSVVAREYGIPAVVGVVDATKHIRTGQRIRVDGDTGYVEYLDIQNHEMEMSLA